MTNLCLARDKGKSRSLALLGMTTFDGATESDGLEEKACLGFVDGFKLGARAGRGFAFRCPTLRPARFPAEENCFGLTQLFEWNSCVGNLDFPARFLSFTCGGLHVSIKDTLGLRSGSCYLCRSI